MKKHRLLSFTYFYSAILPTTHQAALITSGQTGSSLFCATAVFAIVTGREDSERSFATQEIAAGRVVGFAGACSYPVDALLRKLLCIEPLHLAACRQRNCETCCRKYVQKPMDHDSAQGMGNA